MQIDLSGTHLRTILNGMDFKFVSHGLWSEKQNILLRHMHKREFLILTNKCGNNLKHENEAEEPWPVSIVFRVYAFFHIYWSKSKILFYAWVDEGCSASPTIAYEKQT